MFFDLPPDPPKLWLPPKPAIIRGAPELIKPEPLALFGASARRRGAAPPNVVAEYVSEATDTAGGTTMTYVGMNYGAAAADRYLVACCSHNTGSTTRTIDSCSIGGVAATQIINVRNNAGFTNRVSAAIFIALVPTGTSGNTVVNHSGSVGRAGCVVLRLTGLLNAGAAFSTQSDLDGSDPIALASLATTAGAVFIGLASAFCSGATTYTWSGGPTEAADLSMGSDSRITVGIQLALTGAAISPSADNSGTIESSQQLMAGAVFR